jgi:hypothetical protein
MNTLIAILFFMAILINFFLYKKAEDIWDRDVAMVISWFITSMAFGLGFTVASDLGLPARGSLTFPLAIVIDVGLVSVLSFALSIYDGYDFELPNIRISAPIKIMVEAIGFIASILGIVSFLLGR